MTTKTSSAFQSTTEFTPVKILATPMVSAVKTSGTDNLTEFKLVKNYPSIERNT